MKTKIFAATGFAVVLIIGSCTWFSGNKKNYADTNNILAGRYKLINITDSSTEQKWKPGDTLKWLFNLPFKDTLQRYLNFSADSLITYETATEIDSTRYYADSSNKIIYIKSDSSYQPYTIIQQPDSIINLSAANDSVYLILRKL